MARDKGEGVAGTGREQARHRFGHELAQITIRFGVTGKHGRDKGMASEHSHDDSLVLAFWGVKGGRFVLLGQS